MPSPGFIPAHGNYQDLLSYQKAEVVYDLTFRFCQRFLLDQQIRRLEQDFLKEGGLRERMTHARLESRGAGRG